MHATARQLRCSTNVFKQLSSRSILSPCTTTPSPCRRTLATMSSAGTYARTWTPHSRRQTDPSLTFPLLLQCRQPPHRRLRPFRRRQINPPQAPLRRVPRALRLQHFAHDPRASRRRRERARVPLCHKRGFHQTGGSQWLYRERSVRQQPVRHERASCQGCEGQGPDLYSGH